ncbi:MULTISPECIES: tRNA pseudouridine(55) synthase TruB [unclassified Bosea (in: a-proteobacteria)]|uniref:tRNA pseudouridine(55) synthase TruB n=1 Tax=unclassified Bosea (in: a-proteobacteria) TaxID=2653178 RepID=UPI000955698A|nr:MULTISPECIES: tRNA pseudouridine(55) synthase TruB [unclassified Bosea (in: a-proteobacteria)]TAJ30353.1 MAG: tRNA pseudouridine(55) synthase TruB [Bosea sp. (in: a-proteobacteria)]SIQ98025.1 tRNA pseudouridine synthase B [Bosea sp. TND4EK4]
MTADSPNQSASPEDSARPPRPKKRDVHGWVVLDKPVGMTSTHAVSVVKRAFSAKKAGHAGTLDPLASGLLPIALGEATKTVPFVMDGRKAYQFTVAWGSQTDTDDTEGRVIATSDERPEASAIAALLPRFTGTILQTPPKYSAIKIAGERAYDLARDGEDVTLEARPVEIDALTIVSHDGGTTTFEAECGKGTYVRAIARDLGLALGCLGHVAHLRRTRVGPFTVAEAASVDTLRESPESALAALQPVKAALTLIPEIVLHRDAANRLKRGQSALLRGAGAPVELEAAYATCAGTLVSTGSVQNGEFVPHRVFNL